MSAAAPLLRCTRGTLVRELVRNACYDVLQIYDGRLRVGTVRVGTDPCAAAAHIAMMISAFVAQRRQREALSRQMRGRVA